MFKRSFLTTIENASTHSLMRETNKKVFVITSDEPHIRIQGNLDLPMVNSGGIQNNFLKLIGLEQ